MTRKAYEQLIQENIDWLLKMPRTLERNHIIKVLRVSPDREYGEAPSAPIDEKTLTDAEANAMLEALRKHFGEPVLPISRYCDALRTWQMAWHERAARFVAEAYPGIDDEGSAPEARAAAQRLRSDDFFHGRPTGASEERINDRIHAIGATRAAADIDSVFLKIRKSNLLWRLLYNGQPLRTTLCPLHKGKWSGCFLKEPCDCEDNGNVTGWLPNTPDKPT